LSRYGVPFVKGPQNVLSPHPKSCELQDVATLAKSLKRPLAIDLFSGAGGLSLGLHAAGFEVIVAVDIEKEAVETHRAHFKGASVCLDLSKQESVDAICDALEGVQLDLVAGGPPCQPYSQAAFSKVRHLQKYHGKVADPRRDLWPAFVEIVRRTRPKAVLIENVPDMAFGRDGIVLRRVVSMLEHLGYTVDARVLSSEGYGVPQHRQRLFTVAFKEPRQFEWPKGDVRVKRLLWDAISDLPEVVGGDKTARRPYPGKKVASQGYYRQGMRGRTGRFIYDHYTRAVRADDLEAFKLMTSTTKYSDLPQHLKRYRDDIFEDKYKRLGWYELSRTITAHISQDGYWYIHPEQHRTLTIREAARIQTFPDHFRFAGFPRHAFKQIGEAVPPLLAKAVGSAISKALTKKPLDQSTSTAKVTEVIERWLDKEESGGMTNPWLLTDNLWHRFFGQLVFARAPQLLVAKHYERLCSKWRSAREYLDDGCRLECLESIGKQACASALDGIARLLSEGEVPALDSLKRAGVGEAPAYVLLAIAGLGNRRPVTGSLARLSCRFWSREVTDDDGRGATELLVGRLTGEDKDGKIYCGLIELATRYCTPNKAQCRFCPLAELCLTAKTSKATSDPQLFEASS
jgi:DNA (cytosine-5)-methyltransferase 1